MAAKQAKARQCIRHVMSGGHSAKHSFPLCPYFRGGIRFIQYLFFTHGLLAGKVWIDVISGCCAVGSAPALGAGGPGFESPHSDQVHVVKMLSCPSSQCFQRIQGLRIMKSEGLEILLSASRFPKPTRVKLTHPTFPHRPSEAHPAKQQILLAPSTALVRADGRRFFALFTPHASAAPRH